MNIKKIAFINPRLSTSNVGDFFIESSIKTILKYDTVNSIDIDPRKPLSNQDIENINKCDTAVILGTNLWYQCITKPGRWMIGIEDLKKISIPFIPLGVGTTQHKGEENTFRFEEESLTLIKEIHNRCVESSSRDPRTYETLQKAGIKNTRMTGCPTLFRSLDSEWKLNIKKTDKVVLTARKGHDHNIDIIIKELIKRNKKPIIAAQKKNDLYCARRRFPSFKKEVESIYEFNIEPYKNLVDQAYGAIGWRLHGNMFHLAHGNPTMFFANCSRCLSFSEAFDLPCIYAEDKEIIKKADLINSVERFLDADYFSGFKVKYSLYYKELSDFLSKNGLDHNLK
ncbi:polysaccharide pyruvyl transferase family protein [Patescibacteria group bacterium]|nr:polysaccharide pyruvyl transferase family protein [Patescibacteria group bacterium]